MFLWYFVDFFFPFFCFFVCFVMMCFSGFLFNFFCCFGFELFDLKLCPGQFLFLFSLSLFGIIWHVWFWKYIILCDVGFERFDLCMVLFFLCKNIYASLNSERKEWDNFKVSEKKKWLICLFCKCLLIFAREMATLFCKHIGRALVFFLNKKMFWNQVFEGVDEIQWWYCLHVFCHTLLFL